MDLKAFSGSFAEFRPVVGEFATTVDALEVFSRHDARASTIKDYAYKARHFQAFIEQNGFTRGVLKDYKRHLRTDSKVRTPRSRNAYLGAASVFVSLICKSIDIDPAYFDKYKSFRARKGNVTFGFSLNEVQSIDVELSKIEHDYKRARARALFSLMAFAGLRSIEAVSLQGGLIHFDKSIAFVYSKTTDEPRKVFLNSIVVKALREYQSLIDTHSGYWFTGMRGPQTEHLTTQGARDIFKPIFRVLEIKGKGLHSFRHFFATQLLIAFGGDLLKAMRFTGHNSVNGIRAYDNRSEEEDVKLFNNVF